MKVIGFFNNKGGVGKTTLVYHLACMFCELGHRVLAADLDPQANLTAMSFDEIQISMIEDDDIESIYDVIAPVISKGSEIQPQATKVSSGFFLLPGDLDLSSTEDALSGEWTKCLSDSPLDRERAFSVTTSLARAVRRAANQVDADIALIDVGPNLGAINRSALLAADYVVVPVAPDIFSLKGLSNVGRGLADWRKGWARRLENSPEYPEPWPAAQMIPIGYVVSRFSIYAGEKSAHFRRWIDRVPKAFHDDVLGETTRPPRSVEDDSSCLAWLKDYRSLIPMAQEARKPIFSLRPRDGAIGAHQSAVISAYNDFRNLAENILTHINEVEERLLSSSDVW
jgi:cellulose biosynthesis protein BcsQ